MLENINLKPSVNKITVFRSPLNTLEKELEVCVGHVKEHLDEF